MFETETVGPCLVQKLKWGDHGPLGPSSGYALVEASFERYVHFLIMGDFIVDVSEPFNDFILDSL